MRDACIRCVVMRLKYTCLEFIKNSVVAAKMRADDWDGKRETALTSGWYWLSLSLSHTHTLTHKHRSADDVEMQSHFFVEWTFCLKEQWRSARWSKSAVSAFDRLMRKVVCVWERGREWKNQHEREGWLSLWEGECRGWRVREGAKSRMTGHPEANVKWMDEIWQWKVRE